MSKLLGWKEMPIGTLILKPGSTEEVKTGDWRTFKPVIDHNKCTRCTLCYYYCPDGSIILKTENGKVVKVDVDYYHCKGCGICAKICPVKAISMVEEVR